MDEMSKIDFHDIEDLARLICGVDDEADIDEALWMKFDISFDSFAKLIEKLVDYTPQGMTRFSDKMYTGFVNDNCFVVKKEVENNE